VRFRLLTDIEIKGWLDRKTIEQIDSQGAIKHLKGLHAKVYIIDNHALITSANLTEQAFCRRCEIGVFLSPRDALNKCYFLLSELSCRSGNPAVTAS